MEINWRHCFQSNLQYSKVLLFSISNRGGWALLMSTRPLINRYTCISGTAPPR